MTRQQAMVKANEKKVRGAIQGPAERIANGWWNIHELLMKQGMGLEEIEKLLSNPDERLRLARKLYDEIQGVKQEIVPATAEFAKKFGIIEEVGDIHGPVGGKIFRALTITNWGISTLDYAIYNCFKIVEGYLNREFRVPYKHHKGQKVQVVYLLWFGNKEASMTAESAMNWVHLRGLKWQWADYLIPMSVIACAPTVVSQLKSHTFRSDNIRIVSGQQCSVGGKAVIPYTYMIHGDRLTGAEEVSKEWESNTLFVFQAES